MSDIIATPPPPPIPKYYDQDYSYSKEKTGFTAYVKIALAGKFPITALKVDDKPDRTYLDLTSIEKS